MGLRARKSIKLFPGVSVNLGKTGASLSVGGKGAKVNIGKKGVRTTVGIPGTGISYTTTAKPSRRNIPPATATSAPTSGSAAEPIPSWAKVALVFLLLMILAKCMAG
jgi:hypothetical protein